MPQSVEGYEARATECAWLARLTADALIRAELLNLRQSCLRFANRLHSQRFEDVPKTALNGRTP